MLSIKDIKFLLKNKKKLLCKKQKLLKKLFLKKIQLQTSKLLL